VLLSRSIFIVQFVAGIGRASFPQETSRKQDVLSRSIFIVQSVAGIVPATNAFNGGHRSRSIFIVPFRVGHRSRCGRIAKRASLPMQLYRTMRGGHRSCCMAGIAPDPFLSHDPLQALFTSAATLW